MEHAVSDIAALGARAEAMISELGQISAEPGRLVRLYLTPEHRRAADLVAGWMRTAGMAVSEDALGTVRGRWTGRRASPAKPKRLLIGSHLDTVIDAGKFDGPFGVIAGILAIQHIAHTGKALPFGIDVLAFGDEEGSRFPSTLATSAACVGAFDAATLGLVDRNGVTFAEALRRYGKDIDAIPSAAYRPADAAAYVEVHIEQGPVLERENEPLGVVTGIVGQSRMRVTVWGEAGHAGTVPMRFRRDALAGATEMALRVERIARAHAQDGMVATVGRMDVMPGASNIIPGRVDFTVDLRAMSDVARLKAVEALRTQAADIAETRRLDVAFERFHDAAAVDCAPALQQAFAASISALGHHPVHLPSGAGHDAQMMARLCPSAMLFVRCRRGISHNPAEYASPGDMGLAVAALIHFIENFAPPAR
jgi:allantoate deiminase